MKKFLFAVSISFLLVQISIAQEKAVKPKTPEFTKAEVLAYKNILDFLSAVNPGTDYSAYIVRSFDLSTTLIDAEGTEQRFSALGPGGTWSVEQKELIEKGKKGAVYVVENIRAVRAGTKGLQQLQGFSFIIKE